MSRVIRFHRTGGPEVLQIDEIDVPAPGANEVQINVRALGINRAEVMYRTGQYVIEPTFPAMLGYEAAGTVSAVGPGVVGFAVGDAVSVVPAFSFDEYGLYGELVNAPAHAVVKHPEALSFTEAAATWMKFVTAYGALIELGGLQAGETVLIRAASSSVGLAAIQIANMVGAVPVALTRTSDKREALLQAGAAAVIATQEQDMVAEVMTMTHGKGARMAFDPVGGPEVALVLKALANHGIFFQYGAFGHSGYPCVGHGPARQASDAAWLSAVRDHPGSRKTRTGQALHQRRARLWAAAAGNRPYIQLRRDGRGSPVHGIECPGGQDCCNALNHVQVFAAWPVGSLSISPCQLDASLTHAQTGGSMTTPLTLVATLVAKAGSEDELQQTLQDLQGASRAEADCIQYDFHKDAEQPRTFHMVEQWRDEAALTAHEATPHFQAALPVIERAAEKFSVMKMYRVS